MTTTYGQPMVTPVSSILSVMDRVNDEEIKVFVSKNLHRVAIMLGLFVRDFPTWDPLLGCLRSEYMREFKSFLLEFKSFLLEFIDQQPDLHLDFTSERFIQFGAILGDEAMKLIPDDVLFGRRQAA